MGNARKAAYHLDSAKEFYLKISDSMKIAEIKELQASSDIESGRFDEALVKLRSSYSHYSDVFDRNKRVRCLRKIADILAIKGDFKESLARYKKVQELMPDKTNTIENSIISLNRARINQYLSNYEKTKEEYKIAERFFFENNLDDILTQIIGEKGLLYIFSEEDELFEGIINDLQERADEGKKDADIWIHYLKGIKQIQNREYNEAYGNLITTLQSTLESNNLISVGILFNLIRTIVEIYKENLKQPFISEEVKNYIGLINGIVTESHYFYLKGILYLVNLLWQLIAEDEDYNEIIVQASEYYASTGIEEFGSLLLILQYNIGEWFGQKDTRIHSILATPKKYGSPEEALMEILVKAGKAIILEKLLTIEKEILQQMH